MCGNYENFAAFVFKLEKGPCFLNFLSLSLRFLRLCLGRNHGR